MVDPITGSAAVSLALGAAGTGISMFGAAQEGSANASMYQYKAGVAQLNKQINQQNANWAIEAGETQAMESGLKSRQQIAQTKVIQAASGFDVNSGTGAAVRDSQVEVAGFDQNIIRFDAAKTAYGYETKSATDEAESNLDLMASSQAKTAGNIKALSSFVSGAASLGSKYSAGKTAGMFSSSNPYYGPLDFNG